jgi:hypothetical protein
VKKKVFKKKTRIRKNPPESPAVILRGHQKNAGKMKNAGGIEKRGGNKKRWGNRKTRGE